MRQLKYILMLGFLALMALSSCKKETEGISEMVYYPELKGKNGVTAKVGSYVEAGVEADGRDVTSECKISPNLANETKPGAYTVKYEYETNGVEVTLTRDVYLQDPSDNISGYYRYASYDRTGGFSDAYKARFAVGYLLIEKDETAGSDVYYLEDVLLGHYIVGAGYDSRYACPAYVKLNSDNSVTLESLIQPIKPWGDDESAYTYEGGSYDADSKMFTLSTTYGPIKRTIKMELVLNE